MGFKFSDMVTMDKTWNWLTFCDHGSIFNVTGGHYVSKLTLFTQYFLKKIANGFQILRYGDHGQDLELINVSWQWLNGVIMFQNSVCLLNMFCSFVPMAFKLRHFLYIFQNGRLATIFITRKNIFFTLLFLFEISLLCYFLG